VYGQEAVLPVEVNLGAYRLAKQNDLSVDTYYALMMDNIDEVADKCLEALEAIEKDKRRVAGAYNKRVKAKSFQVEDLVWKTILPIGSKSNKFGKWSPSWEGPYKVVRVCFVNSYMVESLQGQQLPRALNGRYLKKFYPSVWKMLEGLWPVSMKIVLSIKKWPTTALSSLELFFSTQALLKTGGMC
jgi:hypothetical protein